MPTLGGVGDDALVVAVGEHPPPPTPERRIDRLGHADLERLNPSTQRAPVDGLADQVDVPPLDAEVNDAKAGRRPLCRIGRVEEKSLCPRRVGSPPTIRVDTCTGWLLSRNGRRVWAT